MPRQTTEYKVFISSPSDIAEDRQVAKRAVEAASRILSSKNIRLESWLWEENTTSEFGKPAQEIIVNQLGEYDFYVGMMGSSFGSPTANFGSGTEEEFYAALAAFENKKLRRMGFFLKNVPLDSNSLTTASIIQLQKVHEFKEKLGGHGLYKIYADKPRLQQLITEFLVLEFSKPEGPDGESPTGGPDKSRNETEPHRGIAPTFRNEVLDQLDSEVRNGNTHLKSGDLWIELDLKAAITTKGAEVKSVNYNLSTIVERATQSQSFRFSGGETAGKSTLCTRLFVRLYELGYYPVLIPGQRLAFTDEIRLKSRIVYGLSEQYENLSQADARLLPIDRIIIIIDDFDHNKLGLHGSLQNMATLKLLAHSVIITTSLSFNFAVLEATDQLKVLSSYIPVQIQEMGQRKRYELIERWYETRHDTRANGEITRNKIEATRSEIDRILINHIVPRTPLIVLVLLRAFESHQTSDLAYSGYVRYYKFLIDNLILRNLKIDEVEYAYALLPELAWAIYNREDGLLTATDADQVIDAFADRRDLRRSSLYSVLESLRKVGMFDPDKSAYQFRHAYAFNFFLADYMSQNIQTTAMEDHIKSLCANSWSRETANILVFVSFHSDSAVVRSSLIAQLQSAYEGVPEFDFSRESTAAFNALMKEAPRPIADSEGTKERRQERLEAEDVGAERRRLVDQKRPLGEMERVFAAVEILGHILRNHYARLESTPKREMLDAANSAILRCVHFLLDRLSHSVELLINFASAALVEVSEELTDAERDEIARTLVFLIATAFVVYCCRKLSKAVGDENLEITYKQAILNNPEIARRILDVIIRLDCFKDFPYTDLGTIFAEVKDNYLVAGLLRTAVSERLDMRPPAAHADFQRYCKVVGLKVKDRLVERNKLGTTARQPSAPTKRG